MDRLKPMCFPFIQNWGIESVRFWLFVLLDGLVLYPTQQLRLYGDIDSVLSFVQRTGQA